MWGQRVVIPKVHQSAVLTALHANHPGIVRMKPLARSYLWWPKIDENIKQTIKQCSMCQQMRPDNSRAIGYTWEGTKNPWSRIHIDFAGPLKGNLFFLVVDSYSKWLEVYQVSATSSSCAMAVLRQLFSTHGLPDIFVSNNGTAFTSFDFKTFCENNLIKHLFSAPFHPSTNGQVERMVRTTKDYLKKGTHGDIKLRLARFLLDQHVTPHSATGRSPAELLFNRRPQTYFDKVHPDIRTSDSKDRYFENSYTHRFRASLVS